METTTSNALETEHLKWLNTLDFYKQQVVLMEDEISEFAATNPPRSLTPRIEQFQNRFIRQREVLDTLRHNIKAHENEIERMTNFALEYLRDRVTREHLKLKVESKRFMQLEQDFQDFLA
jgi:hypothetical protein